MNRLLFALLLAVSARSEDLAVTLKPFEPAPSEFYRRDDKFAHPPEVIPPRFLFPFEYRRGGGAVTPAEVVVLVQLDGHGRATQLKVLSAEREPFARSAIEALKKAEWDSKATLWFYCRHVYTLED